MLRCLLTLGFLSLATAASGFIQVNLPLDEGSEPDVSKSDGTYHFYYYSNPQWQWTFDDGGYTGVNFDPTDNEGDTTDSAYKVTYVDSSWYFNDMEGPYDITLYICEDVEGAPDLDSPRYEYGPYEPEYYSDWDEHEVSPPVQFNVGDICWVVFSIPAEYGHPISDNDGNSGHSWISADGYDWELMEEQVGVDWCIEVYAEPGPGSDYEPPYITDMYPLNGDWPCGVPPAEDTAGCRWKDGDPEDNFGVDANASTFEVRDHNGTLQVGELDIGDSDIFDVIVVFDVDGVWEENENYAVETECYDLAWNSDSAFWIFSTGYTNVVEKSLGAIKAGFAE